MKVVTARRIALVEIGWGEENAALRRGVERLSEMGHEVQRITSSRSEEADRMLKDLAAFGFDVVAAVGGDGTLHHVVNAVKTHFRSPCAVGLIPTGTGNDFAAAFGIPKDPEDACILIGEEMPRPIDLGAMNGTYFINVASGGFGADVTVNTSLEIKNLLGRFAYVVTGLKKITGLEPAEVSIQADDFSWSGKAYALSVGNGRQAGGGFKICPEADLEDGLLDLTIIPEVPLNDFPSLLRDYVRLGKHPSLDHIKYVKAKEIRVEAALEMDLNLDGEPFREKSFQFEVVPHALSFLLPRGGGTD